MLGTRQPEIYGSVTLNEIEGMLLQRFEGRALISFYQSNDEGELVKMIHDSRYKDGIVLNAAAFTHTSIALADAVAAVAVPVIEVHLSNIHAREHFRQQSLTGRYCRGMIAGLGQKGYELAIQYLIDL